MEMSNSTLLEELSNEIFCEIFDYLNAFDLFFAFASLNSRISSILKLTRLHVVIYSTYCRRQIDILSHHLTFHSDQVISLNIYDKIRDQTNVAAYLYNRHPFLNLHSCIVWCFHFSPKLKNMIKQLKKQTQIVSLHIVQSSNATEDQLCGIYAQLFSQMILLNTPPALRSATLRFHSDHPLMRNKIIYTKLTCLELVFYDTPDNVSIDSLIPVLLIHSALRHLGVIIKTPKVSEDENYLNVPNLSSINTDDLPTLLLLKSFDLQILTQCDIDFLDIILHCMPNLREFSFTFIVGLLDIPYYDILLDGNNWQQMLTSHVPYLNKFDFHISFLMFEESYDLDFILNSFRCFVTQYDGWHMAISRWETFQGIVPYEYFVLRTLNYNQSKARHQHLTTIDICYGTYETRSTDTSNANYHRFHSHIDMIEFYMATNMERPVIPVTPNIPFRNVRYLVVYLSLIKPSIISFLKNVFTSIFMHSHRNESREYLDNLKSLIDLSNIIQLNIGRKNDLTCSHVVPHILLTCPNVENLVIGTSLLFLPTIIDNPDLTLTFNRIKRLKTTADHMYFPLKYVSKFVQRFSSLICVEIDVYSVDSCVPIVDILLGGLEKLRSLVVRFSHDSLLDDPCSREYVIEKRRQSFGLSQNAEYKVIVKIENHTLFIWIA